MLIKTLFLYLIIVALSSQEKVANNVIEDLFSNTDGWEISVNEPNFIHPGYKAVQQITAVNKSVIKHLTIRDKDSMVDGKVVFFYGPKISEEEREKIKLCVVGLYTKGSFLAHKYGVSWYYYCHSTVAREETLFIHKIWGKLNKLESN